MFLNKPYRGGSDMKLSNVKIDYHRNGVAGDPFHVATFTMREGKEKHHMVAVLFEKRQCAVFDIDELVKDNIAFAKGNSWRGDHFEDELRQKIKAMDREDFFENHFEVIGGTENQNKQVKKLIKNGFIK
jgi:hypothetical protein